MPDRDEDNLRMGKYLTETGEELLRSTIARILPDARPDLPRDCVRVTLMERGVVLGSMKREAPDRWVLSRAADAGDWFALVLGTEAEALRVLTEAVQRPDPFADA
jgi:hypothetical protein